MTHWIHFPVSPSIPWKLYPVTLPQRGSGHYKHQTWDPSGMNKCIWHPSQTLLIWTKLPVTRPQRLPMAGKFSPCWRFWIDEALWKATEGSLPVCLMSVMRNWWWRPWLHFPFKDTHQRVRRTNGFPSDKSQNTKHWKVRSVCGDRQIAGNPVMIFHCATTECSNVIHLLSGMVTFI